MVVAVVAVAADASSFLTYFDKPPEPLSSWRLFLALVFVPSVCRVCAGCVPGVCRVLNV